MYIFLLCLVKDGQENNSARRAYVCILSRRFEGVKTNLLIELELTYSSKSEGVGPFSLVLSQTKGYPPLGDYFHFPFFRFVL